MCICDVSSMHKNYHILIYFFKIEIYFYSYEIKNKSEDNEIIDINYKSVKMIYLCFKYKKYTSNNK